MPRFVLRGREFEMFRADFEKTAEGLTPGGIQKYFVTINGRKYPIRQVLSATTGLKPIAITSQDAYRVLTMFGFIVEEEQGMPSKSKDERMVTAPKAADFRSELLRQLAEAQRSGKPWLDVNSGELHRKVGAYPGAHHRMPMCCNVMRQLQRQPNDIVISAKNTDGAKFTIRYELPR